MATWDPNPNSNPTLPLTLTLTLTQVANFLNALVAVHQLDGYLGYQCLGAIAGPADNGSGTGRALA